MKPRRRFFRPVFAFFILLALFSGATFTIVSLALAGFDGRHVRIISARADASPQSSDADAADTASAAWPPAEFPTSDALVGDAAAQRLVGVATPLPTQSTPPTWASRFTGITDGVATPDKVVALTIDDGPTENTSAVIQLLDRYDAHATFFWVGARITDDMAALAIEHGEELANHTWNHPNMALLNSAEASAEIGLCSARIAQVTGHPPVWFRSPFNRLFAPELQQVRAHGLLYANYNVTSADWIDSMTVAEVVGKVRGTLRPGGVILMHDSPGRPTKALEPVLQMLQSRGYRVVTLTDLARLGDPVNSPLHLGMKGLEW